MSRKLWEKLITGALYAIPLVLLVDVFMQVRIDRLFDLLATHWLDALKIIALFVLAHLVRLFRLYVLLIERKEKIGTLAEIYLRSTLASNILPFKTGDLYRVIVYGRMLNDLLKGLVLIWVDRFFDTLVLAAIVLFLLRGSLQFQVSIVTLVFIALSVLAFISFQSTYLYFNKLFLTLSKTKKGVYYLRVLASLKELHTFAVKLVSSRFVILILLSALVWMVEFTMLSLLSALVHIPFSFSGFLSYLNQAFSSQNLAENALLTNHLSITLLFVLLMFVWILLGINALRKKYAE